MFVRPIRVTVVLSISALSVFVSACAEGASSRLGGRVEGVVLAGPTCPVERPDQPCPPRPVSGEVRLMHDGDIAARIAADQTGHYALDAAAGDYTLVVDVGGPFPTCPATPVKLTAAITVTVNVACDTGIR